MTIPPEEDKAQSLVQQINTAYDAVMLAEGNALKEKITLGHLLNLAKGSMAHGQWADWLKQHCHNISHRSANVYMDLARHREELEKKMKSSSQRAAILGGGDELSSVRQAIKETRTDEEKAKIEERTRKAKLAKELAKANSPARKQLGGLDASGVLEVLIATFDADFLSTLAEGLDQHIAKDLGQVALKRTRLLAVEGLPPNQLSA